MNEGAIEDNLSLLSVNQHSNPELVSIRKRLVAPNNLLPSKMIRSQSPVHILPVQRDFQSQAGHQMLLDSIQQQYESQSDRLAFSRSKNILMSNSRIRAESNLKERKRKQNLNLVQLSKRQILIKQPGPDILQFLSTSIRSILNYPQKIIFVSKTAILNNQLLPQFKRMTQTERLTNQQKKKLYINWLKQNPYYGTIHYGFDRLKQQQINSLLSYPNTDQYLEFDDSFQSANIYLAMRCDEQLMKIHKKEKEMFSHLYFLNVRLDYNTKSYGQWFYFKVKRKQSPFSFSRHGNNYFKFMIINMTKNSSMFGKGLKISVCRGGVWNKQGINIRYFKNSLKRQDVPIIQTADNDQSLIVNTKRQQTYYTLEFTLEISQGEEIYISYNEPYTFSRLGKVLDNLTQRYQRNKTNIIQFKRSVLCNTYLRNNIQVLTFTVNQTKEYSQGEKKIIFVMGRTHPVETAGSHVVEGILHQFLQLFIENTNQRQKNHPIYGLLQNFVIKIIPMTNPDGVILGNSRCNIAGYDLNRSWKFPCLQKSKEVYFIKKYIMQYQRRIEMFIDLHAHSKKKNVFAYGCHDFSNPYSSRQFPYLLSKLSANDFLFQQCRFTKINEWKENSRRKKNKEGTARVFVYDTLKIPNVFTIQNSYCSAKNSLFHYDKSSYKVIGADILKAISLYFSPQFKKNSWSQTSNTIEVDKNQKNRFSNQSRVQVSVENNYTDFQLTLTINSSVKEGHHRIMMQAQSNSQPINYMDIRTKFLKELHQENSNISIGLLQDDPSESEQQKRLYETKVKNKQKMKTEGSISKGKSARTQRVVNFLNRNVPTPTIQTSINNNFSNIKFSKHNSQTSLAKITKITNINKDRCYTVNKQILFVEDQSQEQEQKGRKEKYLIKRGLKQRKNKQPVQPQQIKIGKKDKFLSVIQIGIEDDVRKMHEYRVNGIERHEPKQRVKSINHFANMKNFQYQQTIKLNLSQANPTLSRQRDEQIKQYMRKLIKPRQHINDQIKDQLKLGEISKQYQRHTSRSRMYLAADLRHSKIMAFQTSKQARFKIQRTVL